MDFAGAFCGAQIVSPGRVLIEIVVIILALWFGLRQFRATEEHPHGRNLIAMSTVISTEDLGKKYRIGHLTAEPYPTLRDELARAPARLWRRAMDTLRGHSILPGETSEDIWALRDVSFAVESGEVVGIIGKNGSGKSTLLKLLARITEPSKGSATIDGSIASLLEIGTGFHPELTGRENIFLNGAILGHDPCRYPQAL